MEEIDIAIIKKKSLVGIVALTSRTFMLQIIAFGATFLLTIFLSPAVFGIFYVVSAIIAFLGYFSDIGLAAALIQKKEELTREDLTTTFTIQQVLVVLLVIVALVFSAQIGYFYRLDTQGVWLFRALVISFFLSSLKTIPSVLLERKLAFELLIIPQLIETLGFYVVAVLLAWQGMGISSFTWAVLVRGIVGLVAIYIVSPWMPSVGFSRNVARRLLRFGVPFQLNSFLGLLKDDLLTVYLGKVLPFAQVGYIGWAKKWAEVPLRLIMDSVIRVTFPAFSRMQHMTKLLGSAIEKTIFGLAATIFPISVGLLFFVEPMVRIIPRYGKWEPAIVSFYFFVVAGVVASLSTPLTNALNAIGKIKITLRLMVFWTISSWVLVTLFITVFGFSGVSIASALLGLSLFIVIYLTRKVVPFAFLPNIVGPIFAAGAEALWFMAVRGNAPYSLVRLGFAGAGGVILYGAVLWLVERKKISDVFRYAKT